MKPYFLWDYDLGDKRMREILAGKNDTEKKWLIGRILTNAHFEDVFQFLSVKDIVTYLPDLPLRPEIRQNWYRALRVWGYL